MGDWCGANVPTPTDGKQGRVTERSRTRREEKRERTKFFLPGEVFASLTCLLMGDLFLGDPGMGMLFTEGCSRHWPAVELFTGTTIKHLTGIALSKFELHLPPLDEQHEIIRRVEALFARADRLEAGYNAARGQVEGLTPALLSKAFSGELVPQDSSDEPAAVLLERVRALRTAVAKLPKPRKGKQTNKEVRDLMQKLLDVLAAATDWLPAEEAFRRCGVSDGSETDRLEELYAELRQLDKAGTLQVRRIGDFDELRLEPKA